MEQVAYFTRGASWFGGPLREQRAVDSVHSGVVPDLFPLPLLAIGSSLVSAVSRRIRSKKRRAARVEAIWVDTNAAIEALNALYGCDRPPSAEISEAQFAAQQRLVESVAAASHLVVPSESEAAAGLLRGRLDYNGTSCTVERYDAERVSLPDGSRPPVPLLRVLPEDAACLLADFNDRMLIDSPGVGMEASLQSDIIKPYFDAKLRSDRSAYILFVRRMVDAGLAGASLTKRATATPFFVEKKGKKQRLVLDCRNSNQYFKRCPDMEIATAEYFGPA